VIDRRSVIKMSSNVIIVNKEEKIGKIAFPSREVLVEQGIKNTLFPK
jgi:hypothetical protein